jgi:membrane associated rhomboid family serine protease
MKFIETCLYVLIVYATFLMGLLRHRPPKKPNYIIIGKAALMAAPATTILVAAIGIMAIMQLFFPDLLHILERNRDLFFRGDWWRLITTLFVQDGGLGGAVFNLVSLAIIGAVSEKIWGHWRLVGIFLICGVCCQFVAFYWQPIGGGNSGANFGLAAATAVFFLHKSEQRNIKILAMALLLSGPILFIMKDIHGAAVISGIVAGYILTKQKYYSKDFSDEISSVRA